MAKEFYFDKLYPFQDEVLRVINGVKTDFYLTGGTTLSRAYLHHRFSEDLDLFVNDDDRFSTWAARVVDSLEQRAGWKVTVLHTDDRFVRCTVAATDAPLRVEMVNDVPAHVGDIVEHPVLGRIDTAENILANKITALIDRDEAKDLADVWGLCTKMGLSLTSAIEDAGCKAACVFPADLARVLCTATEKDWEVILWIQAPPVEQFLSDLRRLGEDLIL